MLDTIEMSHKEMWWNFNFAPRKLYTYMNKLFTLNDSVMAIQETIEEAVRVQLDLKVECQKALFDHKNFLKEQEQLRSERLQKTYPGIVEWVKISKHRNSYRTKYFRI